MHDLNQQQREAVEYMGGPLLVVAGAGSGKTRVITHKIARLIGECGHSPRTIRAVTFTNKAAREMKGRIRERLKGIDIDGLSVSTFHALGLNILRREHERVGLRAGFSLFDNADSESVVKEHMQGGVMESIASPREIATAISRLKNDNLHPEQAHERAESRFDRQVAHLFDRYARSLKAYNAVDFDDLILLPVRLLGADADALERWQGWVRYLLVDEYQDTNGAQYDLVRLIAGVRGALTVVGDDDQSIYAWRGARPENLARLGEDYPHLKVVALEQNYRSSDRILGLANALIAHNPHVFEKRLWSERAGGEPARVLTCKDDTHEASRVVSEILHRHYTQNLPYGSFAILYRGNHQARPFEKALREHGIDYHLSGGTSFFSRTEVKDALAYLRLLSNPEDDTAFLRIVNTPRREIGPGTLEKLAGYAEERGVTLLKACNEMGLGQRLKDRQRERLESFAQWVDGLSKQAEHEPIAAVRRLLKDIDYDSWIREQSSSDEVAERRMENVEDLVNWLSNLQRGDKETLAEMVNHLCLMDVLERQNEDDGDDKVFLMTLHAAKGLEFDHVFVTGVEEGLLPHRTSVEEGMLEEERRLMYVGITRARRSITFTWAKGRGGREATTKGEPSRFLAEMPENELVWDGKHASTEEERRARAGSHLANLKSLLGS